MKGTRYKASGMVSGIMLPMGLICLFAFCTLALSLMGGRAYRDIHNATAEDYTPVIASNYLRTKLSQNNREDAVELRSENGVQVLVVHGESDGFAYETRIFESNGTLRESFVPADREFSPTSGVQLCQVSACSFSLSADGLLEAEIEDNAGAVSRVAVRLVGGAQ